MLAASSINAAIKYKGLIEKHFEQLTKEKKYERFADAPIYIVYSSDGQKYVSSSNLNGNLSEAKVLQNFANEKNGLNYRC